MIPYMWLIISNKFTVFFLFPKFKYPLNNINIFLTSHIIRLLLYFELLLLAAQLKLTATTQIIDEAKRRNRRSKIKLYIFDFLLSCRSSAASKDS